MKSDERNGLSSQEAQVRLQSVGQNELPQVRGPHPLKLLAQQFHQPLVYILIGAGGISLALGHGVDSTVIFGVVALNGTIGFLQEFKALRALHSLRRVLKQEACVLREGEIHHIHAETLVPGDIVILHPGDRVPADLRLLYTQGCEIDESNLTGESTPVEKHSAPMAEKTLLADRSNMAYAATLVLKGQATGVVIATGRATQVGQISQLISQASPAETPFLTKISIFSQTLLHIIIGLALVTFVVGLFQGHTPMDMLMAAVALAVGAIPEGLPAAMTIILALGVSHMAQKKAIIRKLPAVETLGSTTVICSDKTGTLTKNQMTVTRLWTLHQGYRVEGTGYQPVGSLEPEASGSQEGTPSGIPTISRDELLQGGVLCNEAVLYEDENTEPLNTTEPQWALSGDPTEGALVVVARKAGLHEGTLREWLPTLDILPFESERQWMATLHPLSETQQVIYVKGAPERILSMCSQVMAPDGSIVPISPAITEAVETTITQWTGEGLRVLGLAKTLTKAPQTRLLIDTLPKEPFTLLGLFAMGDPPREGVQEALQKAHRAGIQIKIVTGDHALTAQALAHQVRLPAPSPHEPLAFVTGQELAEWNDETLRAAVERISIFARVTPEQKFRLVKALQHHGHTVAMTGDGVNDAPALKQADIGVAMGFRGTEVAKDAADMILTDDHFATLIDAIETGRSVFQNLTKFIIWTLPTNLGEGLIILAGVFSGAILPILPVQILWINMTTAVFLGLTLAFEPKEAHMMDLPPRDPKAPILDKLLLERIFLVGILMLITSFGLFEWKLRTGASLAEARTVAVNCFVAIEIFYLFNCRSLDQWLPLPSPVQEGHKTQNLALPIGIAMMVFLQLAFTYMPILHQAFHTASISLHDWGYILLCGLLAYGTIEGEKAYRRKKRPTPSLS